MRELVRKHLRFFLLVALAAVALRLFFILRFPAITNDSRLYADIAKNWFQHGIYGFTDNNDIVPTFIRLPGYPAFLGLVFAIFGVDHYRPVLLVQMIFDIGTCLIVADMTRRTTSERAAQLACLLAALCPFLANYTAAVLTETLEIFFTALALDCAIAGLAGVDEGRRWPWIGCGLAVGAAILLRPDGGILLFSIGLYLGWVWVKRLRAGHVAVHLLQSGMTVAVLALVPLVPWTLRNLHTMHRFQPLAPRYANEGDEFVPRGFHRWVKTWMADYVSVQEIYWNIPGETADPGKLPARAFDTPQEQQRTLDLFAAYNQELHVSPELDAQFDELAEERIRAAPRRYYLWLPLLRIADMWLRPRTELLPPDPRWWEFNDDPRWSAVAVGLGIINLLYAGAAIVGLIRGRTMGLLVLLLLFVCVRSLFLGTLENPEPRYTLECYPVVVLLMARIFI